MCNFLVLPTPVSPYGIELNSLLQGKTNYIYIYIYNCRRINRVNEEKN